MTDVAHKSLEGTVELVGELKPKTKSAARVIMTVIVALLVAGLVRGFLIQQYHVVGPSMEPTLRPGDRIIVNKIVYKIGDVSRGDIIVFERRDTKREDLVKRVIGEPGDTVSIKNCVTYVNGEPLREPYISKSAEATCQGEDMRAFYVPSNHYFVMGDNRSVSMDSRKFGAITRDQIQGRVTLVVWPRDNWGTP